MAHFLVSIWLLIPLTALIASALIARQPAGNIRTGAMIALAVAILQGIVTMNVSSTPDDDRVILILAFGIAAFVGFFHRELTGHAQGWVAKNAAYIWAIGIGGALIMFAPALAKSLLALALAIGSIRVIIFGLPRKKKDDKSGH